MLRTIPTLHQITVVPDGQMAVSIDTVQTVRMTAAANYEWELAQARIHRENAFRYMDSAVRSHLRSLAVQCIKRAREWRSVAVSTGLALNNWNDYLRRAA